MMKQYLLLVFIIGLFSSVYATIEAECKNKSNSDCQTCLNIPDCGFCKNSKTCFLATPSGLINAPCVTAEQQIQTCVGNFQVWIIIVSVIGGVVLIAVLIVICCLCKKCKRCRIRKEERRQERDDQRMEERRAAAEVRSTERNRVADQIRMKYGILKANDTGTDYARMS